ncbi:MAG: hypothetical protein ACEQSE_05840 [Candidatus Aquirickettsiella gammari]
MSTSTALKGGITMTHFQTEILAPISSHGIYVHYRRHPHADAASVLQALQSLQTSDRVQKLFKNGT